MKNQSKRVNLTLPPNTYDKLSEFSKHVDCVKGDKPIVSSAVSKVLRIVLQYYGDDEFQKCLQKEGIDTLSYIQKCVGEGIKETLS